MDKLTDAQRELFRSGGSLDDYEIVKPIGKGKFSVVYRAKRRRDDVLVALKKVNIFNLMDAKAREKTLKEVRLVQSVHHPNIIQYIDAFIGHDDELCIAFEWAEAGDLKRQIRKANEKNTRFDEPVIWKYFAQICAAIQHMHLHRIMHRDIKPANIFLTLAGVVKVGDLGLGRYLSENTMEAHSKVGTPLYMSPEVLRGDGYDWKCDVWSLGCILYELAMLRSPFKSEGLNLYGLFQKVEMQLGMILTWTQELRSLVAQMISLNANDRPTMGRLCEVANAQVNRPSSSSSSPSLRAINKDSNNNTSSSSSLPETNNNNETAEAQPPPPSTNDAANAIVLMDLVYDKLVLLDYKMQPPLHRMYFASESRNRADQFGHFLSIAEWLLQRLHVAADVRRGHEPPLQKAATVLVCCGHAGVDVGSISPPALTSGFGSGVCALVGAMCDKVLASQKLPRYIMAPAEPDEVSQDDTGDSEWKEDDDLAGEDDGDYDPPWRQDASVILLEPPQIDPDAWRAEIEKNMPKIRQTITDTRTLTHWSLHLEAFRLHGGTLATWEADRMKRLQAIVAEHAETIRAKERAMNAQCQTWREQYQRRKDRHVELANHIAALEVLMADMVETLESITAALATTQAQLKARSDGLTDTTMLAQIKHGLTTIRAEIAAMDTALAIQHHRHFHTSSAA
ncbi:Serine/threonine-protein kinase Nek7 [Aphanomyces cochlioides]|nr:Serine/threonine-protein kinase Nek7 [Aphanomyces cochlioides]